MAKGCAWIVKTQGRPCGRPRTLRPHSALQHGTRHSCRSRKTNAFPLLGATQSMLRASPEGPPARRMRRRPRPVSLLDCPSMLALIREKAATTHD
jgi:hypothetical protein